MLTYLLVLVIYLCSFIMPAGDDITLSHNQKSRITCTTDRGKSRGESSKSKHILLDPQGVDPAAPPKGDMKGVYKRVRSSGTSLLVTLESGETLELKLSAGGDPPAAKRVLDWTKTIKAFSH